MHEKLKIDECQTLIKHFNNANSEEKALLTSTRACSKWIKLGASTRCPT
jgi:DNA repair and recombination RAD54-like protein